MSNPALKFILLLTFALSAAFTGHAYVQHIYNIGSFENHLIINYCFNGILTILFFILFIIAERVQSDQLGYVFLGTSLFKLILFLIFLNPNIKDSEGVKSAEFASFFIPYGISVLLEVVYLIKALKSKA